MATLKSLGFVVVTTAGMPVQVSASQLISALIRFQAKKNQTNENTGNIYIMTANVPAASNPTKIYAILYPGQASDPVEVGGSPFFIGNGLDLSQIWLDADNNGDGALVGYV